MEFSQYLEKYQDRLLAQVLLNWNLLDIEILQQAYLEKNLQNPPCPLGQWLIRQRTLKIQDYTKAMIEVRQQAEQRYQHCNGSDDPSFPTDLSNLSREKKGQSPATSTVLPNTHKKLPAAKNPHHSNTRITGSLNNPKNQPSNLGTTNLASNPNQDGSLDRTKVLPDNESVPDNVSPHAPMITLKDLQANSHPIQGAQLGSYEILEEIARGGMGIIYRARQRYMNRIVALKVLLSGGSASEIEIARFQQEAKAAASLQHPNIVSIYEVGEQNGIHYFTMDLIEGESLQSLIKKRGRPKSFIKILIKIALALEYAHQHGIVHRDIKPSNILISKEGEPKIMDFGLAKQINTESALTESGSTLGTPYYMAPEQILASKDLDGRADVYSLGVILYEILAHRLPFHASTIMELYHRVMDENPPPPSKWNRKIDYDIETICLQAMSKNVEDRYQTAQKLAEDLERYSNGADILAKRLSWWSTLKKSNKAFYKFIATVCIVIVCMISIGIFWGLHIFNSNTPTLRQKEAEMLVQEGRLLLSSDKYEQARQKFTQAKQLMPECVSAYLGVGDSYLAEKQPYYALPEYEHALQINPNLADAYLGRGSSYFILENWDKAINEFNQAIAKDPEFPIVYSKRALAWSKKAIETKEKNSYYEQAMQDLKQSSQLKELLVQRGNSALNKANAEKQNNSKKAQEEYQTAIANYEKVLSASPNDFEIYYARGLAYVGLNQFESAIADFSKTIQLQAQFEKAYYQRSLCYEKIGKIQESQEDIKVFNSLHKQNSTQPTKDKNF